MPACYDALGAKLIARSGAFECAFMSGYGVSASRLGDPDVGLASLADVVDAGAHVCRAAGDVPIVGDGDAGWLGVANVRRTVESFHRAGFAAVTIEDQVFPKRCAFAGGVRVVSRAESLARLRAALDARDGVRARAEACFVVARTDSRLASNIHDGFAEAMWRCEAYQDMGADVVYFEGPDGVKEMETFNRRAGARADDPRAGGKTGREILDATTCAELGYDAVLFGLTLLSASAAAMERTLLAMGAGGRHPTAEGADARPLLPFDELYDAVGFNQHYAAEERYDPSRFADWERTRGSDGA